MKKKNAKIKQYNETNFQKSPCYKKHVRKQRREKFFHLISLSSFLWTLFFLLVSFLLLCVSYFVNQTNPWFSGVLTSIACGIITGVVLYFLSNLRNGQLYALQLENDELYMVYKAGLAVLCEKTMIDNTRAWNLDGVSIQSEAEDIMKKFDELRRALNETNFYVFEKKNGLKELSADVDNLWNEYEYLSDDNDSAKWILDVIDLLEPAMSKLENLIGKSNDQIGFMKKHIF